MHYDEEFQHHPGMCIHGPRPVRIALKIVIGIVLGACVALLLGWAVMLLWNAIMPALLHAGQISYWQSIGLIVLSRILVGGFHHGHGHGRHWGHGRRRECEERWREAAEKSFREAAAKTEAEGK